MYPIRCISGGASRLWNRQLDHYPDTGPRTTYLAITVLATIVLYYELYVQGAVATVRGPKRLCRKPPNPAVIPKTARVIVNVRPTSSFEAP